MIKKEYEKHLKQIERTMKNNNIDVKNNSFIIDNQKIHITNNLIKSIFYDENGNVVKYEDEEILEMFLFEI